MFGASATFMNRDTESVVALAPNIELGSRLSALGSRKITTLEPSYRRLEPRIWWS
jgi:hypothetical protein